MLYRLQTAVIRLTGVHARVHAAGQMASPTALPLPSKGVGPFRALGAGLLLLPQAAGRWRSPRSRPPPPPRIVDRPSPA